MARTPTPFVAPFNRLTAKRPLARSAAVTVVVSQYPCGTATRHRSPRKDRPSRSSTSMAAALSVEEHQALGVEFESALKSALARFSYVWTVLLARVNRPSSTRDVPATMLHASLSRSGADRALTQCRGSALVGRAGKHQAAASSRWRSYNSTRFRPFRFAR